MPVLTGDIALPAGTVVAANIYNADGSIAYAAGTVLRDGTSLAAGMKLGAGTRLMANTAIDALTWPRASSCPCRWPSPGRSLWRAVR
jgi:hypothetical protein